MVENKQVTRNQFVKGLFWRIINLIVTKGITAIVAIYIARSISPEHYGFMSIWSVILSFGNVVVTFGIDTILIKKQSLTDVEWSTALFSSIIRALALYIVLFICAPMVAEFYKMPILSTLIRMASIDFFCKAVMSIGIANATKKMDFRSIFIADFFGTLAGGLAAVLFIFIGKYDYVLISNLVICELVYGLMIITQIKEIKIKFDVDIFYEHCMIGRKIIANGIFDLFTSTISGLFIGKIWDPKTIGYLNRGEKITQMFGVETYNVVSGLLLPTLSSYRNDKDAFKNIGKKILYMSAYIMFPIMTILCVCSERIVLLLFTEKWLPSVPYIRVICIYYGMNAIRQYCLQFNYANGKYNRNSIVEFTRMMMMILPFVIISFIDNPKLIYITIYSAITSIVVVIAFILTISRDLETSTVEIWSNFIKIIFVSVISALPAMVIDAYIYSNIIYISISVSITIFIYLLISKIIGIDSYQYLVRIVNTFIKRERGCI